MIKFEIPYNLDPAYPEKLLQRPALIPYIDCIYAAAWKDDCDNTRFDITFRSDYPTTYEEYVERIKSLLALGIVAVGGLEPMPGVGRVVAHMMTSWRQGSSRNIRKCGLRYPSRGR